MSVLTTVDCKGSRLTSQNKLSIIVAEVSVALMGKLINRCRSAANKLFTNLTVKLLLTSSKFILISPPSKSCVFWFNRDLMRSITKCAPF